MNNFCTYFELESSELEKFIQKKNVTLLCIYSTEIIIVKSIDMFNKVENLFVFISE